MLNEDLPIWRTGDDPRKKIAERVKLSAKGISIHNLLRGTSAVAKAKRAEMVAKIQEETGWTPAAIAMHLGLESPLATKLPAPVPRPKLRAVPTPTKPSPKAEPSPKPAPTPARVGVWATTFDRIAKSLPEPITPTAIVRAMEAAIPALAEKVRAELHHLNGTIEVRVAGAVIGHAKTVRPVRSLRPAPETPERKTVKQAAKEFTEATEMPTTANPPPIQIQAVRLGVLPEVGTTQWWPPVDYGQMPRGASGEDGLKPAVDVTIDPGARFIPTMPLEDLKRAIDEGSDILPDADIPELDPPGPPDMEALARIGMHDPWDRNHWEATVRRNGGNPALAIDSDWRGPAREAVLSAGNAPEHVDAILEGLEEMSRPHLRYGPVIVNDLRLENARLRTELADIREQLAESQKQCRDRAKTIDVIASLARLDREERGEVRS